MEENDVPNVSLVSCMRFVKKGVAKAVPEKVEITEQELAAIIKKTAKDLKIAEEGEDSSENDSDSENEEKTTAKSEEKKVANPDDEFDFEKYDEENGDSNPIGLGSVATVPNLGDLGEHVNIRYLGAYISITIQLGGMAIALVNTVTILSGVETDGPDSDEEDDIIKPTDNLLLVGHVESDASILEVYIYNKEEGSFYVHHDMVLPWFPLCIEWLSHDPSDPQPGNLCALGGMEPIIQVWDLDIENCLEPAFKLGKNANKKKHIKRVGHKDAVLDLAWNKNFTHVIASGSADNTVLLWDLDQGTPHTKLTYFQDKIQSLCWHPHEAQTLLSGSCDKNARVSDCRSDDALRMWTTSGEVERVTWDTLQPYCFAVSTNDGKVFYYDVRQTDPLWTIQAHEKEITGLHINEQIPDLLVTVGAEGTMKTWDTTSNPPTQVSLQSLKVGQTLCMATCPDHPTILAVGGDNKSCYIQMMDLFDSDDVQGKFSSRQPVKVTIEDQMES